MFDTDQFQNKLLKEILISSDVASKQTSSEVLKQKNEQFENKGANDWDNTPFPSLEDVTIDIKEKLGVDEPEKPLVRYGKLSQSLYMEDEDDFTSIKSQDVQNKEGQTYNQNAKNFITQKSSGEKHYYDELTEKEQEGAFAYYFNALMEQLTNGD